MEDTKERVNANLYSKDGEDILEVSIKDAEFKLCINKDCRNEIKDMFSALLGLVFKNDAIVELEIDGDYESQIMRETIGEYVNLLNSEIKKIRAEIKADDSLVILEDSK